jgi:hypothetical protein
MNYGFLPRLKHNWQLVVLLVVLGLSMPSAEVSGQGTKGPSSAITLPPASAFVSPTEANARLVTHIQNEQTSAAALPTGSTAFTQFEHKDMYWKTVTKMLNAGQTVPESLLSAFDAVLAPQLVEENWVAPDQATVLVALYEAEQFLLQ